MERPFDAVGGAACALLHCDDPVNHVSARRPNRDLVARTRPNERAPDG
jgi:hypothetical protein